MEPDITIKEKKNCLINWRERLKEMNDDSDSRDYWSEEQYGDQSMFDSILAELELKMTEWTPDRPCPKEGAALAGPSVKRPKIVCFCGSSRFIEQFGIFMWEYEKAGNIALGLHWLPPSYFDELNRPAADDHQAEAEGLAEKMDELHLRKIDLADEVFILNVGGYIGESTRNEIEYAKKLGKKIKYLEPQGHVAREGEKEEE